MTKIYFTLKMINLIIFLLFLLSLDSVFSGESELKQKIVSVSSIIKNRDKLRQIRRLSPPERTDDDSEEEAALALTFSKIKTRRPMTYRASPNKSSSKSKLSAKDMRDSLEESILKKLIEKKKQQSITDLHRGLPVYDHLAHGTNHHMFNQGNMIHPKDHHHAKYPHYALDPASPLVLTKTQHNPLAPFHPLPPAQTQLSHPGLPAPQKKKRKKDIHNSLLPLDKTLLYFGVAFGGLFWAIIAACFYNWGDKILPSRVSKLGQAADVQNQPIIVRVQPGKPPEYMIGRALQGSSFSFTRVLDMISAAQETYEKFDYQSLDCQKKALCELQQKQEDFGETGRKISSTFSFVEALEGLPMPTIIQTYLKEYKEAIMQGRNSTKDCSSLYPSCAFSIKEVFVKYAKKANKL